jgi:hypothetical protein
MTSGHCLAADLALRAVAAGTAFATGFPVKQARAILGAG